MRRLGVPVGLLAALLLLAAPAQADEGDTWASTPDGVPAAQIDGGPANPRVGDPFKPGAQVSVYETYGYGGIEWKTLPEDDGFLPDVPDAVSDPGNAAANAMANIMLIMLTGWVAFLVSAMRYAFNPHTIGIFDPIMRLSADVLGDNVFRALFWITLIATGIYLLVRATKARLTKVAGGAAWVAMACLLGLMATAWPLVVAPTIDHALTRTISLVNTEAARASGHPALGPADGAAANVHHSLLYETWCSGIVGKGAGSAVAKEYCPRFYKASTLSRAEARRVAGDSEAMQELSNEKYEDYKAAAEDLKEEYPESFAYLAGDKGGSRILYALIAWAGFFFALGFLLVSSLLMLYAMIVVRLAIMVMPLMAVIGGYPPLRRYILSIVDYVAGALFTALVFGSISAIFVAAIAGFMSPDSGTHPLLSLVMLAITSVAAWKFTKPFRRVKHLSHMKKVVKSRGGRDGVDGTDGLPGKDGSKPYVDTAGSHGPAGGAGGGTFTGAAQTAAIAGQYVGATPAEATAPSISQAAWRGARQGAVTTGVLGVASGGTLTAGAVAAGAAKGAAASVAASQYHQAVGNTAASNGHANGQHRIGFHRTPQGRLVGQSLDNGHALTGGQGRRPAEVGKHQAIGAAPRQGPRVQQPQQQPADSPSAPRVYLPGEPSPAERLRVVEPKKAASSSTPVYNIYTGSKK